MPPPSCNSHVFSPDLADCRETATLAIDGRVFGADQHVSIELVLAPETVQRLREALRFFRAARRIQTEINTMPTAADVLNLLTTELPTPAH